MAPLPPASLPPVSLPEVPPFENIPTPSFDDV
jgi:hypothetical protein